MADSEVEVYNMAMSELGTFSSLVGTTDERREAELCNLWYPTARKRVLRTAPWSFALGYRRLALQATRDNDADWVVGDPSPGWLFSYGTPNDFLWPRFMTDYRQFLFAGQTISTNSANPLLAYTRDEDNVSRWDVDFTRAVAFDLAAHCAPGLVGIAAQPAMFQQAESIIMAARASASNEQQFMLETTPSWIAARGSSIMSPQQPYLYPPAEYITTGFNNLG